MGVMLLICLLTAAVLDMSTEDMQYELDSNYLKHRASFEAGDINFCKFSKDDCRALARNTAGDGVAPKNCFEEQQNPYRAPVCEAIEGAPPMTSAAVWPNMWSTATAYYASHGCGHSRYAESSRQVRSCEACEPSAVPTGEEAPDAACQAWFYTGTADNATVTSSDADWHVDNMLERAYESGPPPPPTLSPSSRPTPSPPGYGSSSSYESGEFDGSAAAGRASAFCNYTDEGCKAKLKDNLASGYSVATNLCISLLVFLAIAIYLTFQGIKIHKNPFHKGMSSSGNDDDDDDDEDKSDDDADTFENELND
jgi:hypothetical protein